MSCQRLSSGSESSMPFRTKFGKHYHFKHGCHGADILCGTKGLSPCADCVKGTGAGASGMSGQPAGGGTAGEGGERSETTLQDSIDVMMQALDDATDSDAPESRRKASQELLRKFFSPGGQRLTDSEIEDVLLRASEILQSGVASVQNGQFAPQIPDEEDISEAVRTMILDRFDWKHVLKRQKAPNSPSGKESGTTRRYNNETAGISTELAVAAIGEKPVSVTEKYVRRGDQHLASRVVETVRNIFNETNCPLPISHTAEKGNPIDFWLDGKDSTGRPYTLSVKSNQNTLDKQAGQRIGQMTGNAAKEFFEKTMGYGPFPGGAQGTAEYEQSQNLIREYIRDPVKRTAIITKELEALFECDALLAVSHVVRGEPEAVLVGKYSDFQLDPDKISFVKDREQLPDWKSITIQYDGVSIGEIQMHDSRDTLFKCRFNLRNLLPMLDAEDDAVPTIPAKYTKPPQRQ